MPFINKRRIDDGAYYSAEAFIDALLESKLMDNFTITQKALEELHGLMLSSPELAAKVDEFAVVLAMAAEHAEDIKKFLRMVEKFKSVPR